MPEMTRGEMIAAAKTAWCTHAQPWLHQYAPMYCAQIEAESSWIPGQVSAAGARGLCQMMPATAQRYDLMPEQLDDPETALVAGAKHMAHLVRFAYAPEREVYPATVDDAVQLAVMAYNCGEGWIFMQRSGGRAAASGILRGEGAGFTTENVIRVLPRVTGEHSRETINYINRIRQSAASYR